MPLMVLPDDIITQAKDAVAAGVEPSRFVQEPVVEQHRAMRQWEFLALIGYAAHSPNALRSVASFLQGRMRAFAGTITRNPDVFLAALANSGGVFIDSAVAKIVDPKSSWSIDVVQIATPIGSFRELYDFLKVTEGGTVVQHSGPFEEHEEVFVRGTCERAVIKTPIMTFMLRRSVTESALHPATSVLCDFLINALSPRGFAIGNPRQFVTRCGKRAVLCGPDADEQVRMWRDRGFRVILPTDDEYGGFRNHRECPRTMRYFGDRRCITFWFQEHPPSTDLHDLVWSSGWLFDGDNCEEMDCTTNLLPSACTMLVPRRLSIT